MHAVHIIFVQNLVDEEACNSINFACIIR